MTDTSYTVVVNSDNITGKSTDAALINKCVEALKQAGYNAIASGIGPNWHVTDMRTHKNSYIVCIVGGLCAGTIADYGAKYYQNYMKQNNNKGGQAYFWKYGKYKCGLEQINFLERAWDDNFSPAGFKGIDNPAQYLKEHNFDHCGAATEDGIASAIVNMVKTGASGSAGVGTGSGGASLQKGWVNSGRGSSPQFWNRENYEDYVEIPFKNFRIKDENPRIKTATFETTERLDILDGRDAVLITGDCNDFGGIIIKHEYSRQNHVWKYTCQGFLDRILANEITAVLDGSETAHEIIKKLLEETGLPTCMLLDVDEYDTAVSEDTQKKLKKDADLTETSDQFTQNQQQDTNSDDENTVNIPQATGSSNKTGDTKNTFKRKPVGLYKEKSLGEFIRTLIFDYGINVDFYGDVNGIPHFDVIDLETWKSTGCYIAPQLGIETDYEYSFDITNIITQVGIENISAINGNGEIYTSKDLLGVAIEDFVGRMGVVLENPSANGTVSTNNTQITQKYQDKTGKQYTTDTVLTTNGKPSCSNCTKINGGRQPTYQAYTKYWYNKCPACKEEKVLESDSTDDGKTKCSKCKQEFCQYCGCGLSNSNYQVTELFLTNNNATQSTPGNTTDGEDTQT